MPGFQGDTRRIGGADSVPEPGNANAGLGDARLESRADWGTKPGNGVSSRLSPYTIDTVFSLKIEARNPALGQSA